MTEAAMPAISVVIPTFNRLARLQRVLEALSRQTLDERQFEVVVVSDGCTDGTDEYLASTTPLSVVHGRQDNAGPGAARNHGVRLAGGRLILFLDDDVIATPTLVERHLQAHGDSTSTVVIGPMLNAPGFRYSPWVAWEQDMLYKQSKRCVSVTTARLPPVLHRQRIGSEGAGGEGRRIRYRLPTG